MAGSVTTHYQVEAEDKSQSISYIKKVSGLRQFPPTQGHLSTRRDLIKAVIAFVDHQGETRNDLLWSRHACVQLFGPEECARYVDQILDDCTPLASLFLNAVVSTKFDTVFNVVTYTNLNLINPFRGAQEGIYFVGAFKTDGKVLFGYTGRSVDVGNRLMQHERIITAAELDPDHQTIFYQLARFAHQELGLRIIYQPLITIPPNSTNFTTTILETVFATALGTYQKDDEWLQMRAQYNIPAVPFVGVNSTPCLEVPNDMFS